MCDRTITGSDVTVHGPLFFFLYPPPNVLQTTTTGNECVQTLWCFEGPHLGVVARVHLLCDGRDVLQQELVPLLLKVDLVHVDVDGGHVLVAALDPRVLRGGAGGATAAPSAGCFREF